MTCQHCTTANLEVLRHLEALDADQSRWPKLRARLASHLTGPSWFVLELQDDPPSRVENLTEETLHQLKGDPRWDALDAHLGLEVFGELHAEPRSRFRRLVRKAARDPILFLEHSRWALLRHIAKALR